MKKTDFRSDFKIALDPKGHAQIDPIWRVFDEVKKHNALIIINCEFLSV